MIVKLVSLAVILATATLPLLPGCRAPRTAQPLADLVLLGGPIHTMETNAPTAEALAIGGDRILWVGSRGDAEVYIGPGTEVIDLGGRAAFPGFVDSHAHVAGLGRKLATLDLTGTRSYDEICERVAVAASNRPEGTWITGRGWDQNDWREKGFPDHAALSRTCADHPVILTRVDGHAVLVNRRALEIAGIDASTPDPPGGKILRRPGTGEPTGVLVDLAADLVARHVPEPGPERRKAEILDAIRECRRWGLTGVHDAGIDGDTARIYEELLDEGRLDFRIYAMVEATSPLFDESLARGPVVGLGRHRLTIRAVKLYADGALGSRGAALLEPYADDPGNRGLLLTEPERIREIAVACLRSGFQLCTHAIGDRANRIVLDAYEQALGECPVQDPRLRIEHAQILSPRDIPRFGTLGVIPAMQPTHCTSDMDWAGERLGPSRLAGAYAWRSLLRAGARIPCGSDFPVEDVNPVLGVWAAVTRRHPGDGLGEGWRTEECMSREEAIRGYTVEPAYAAFEEALRGTLAPGKLADVSVFTRDLLTCPEEEILEAQAWLTVVAGRIVYRSDAP